MRAAVLGSPVAHSLSPVLHRAAYAALGLPWTYDALHCDEDGLAPLLAGLGADWAGLSLTMPLKQSVLPLLDTTSDLARDVASANTVLLRDGRRHGDNTDVHGLVAALREAGCAEPSRAVVLGGGATARSALAALRELGAGEIGLLTRSEPAAALGAAARLGMADRVRRVGEDALRGADLVVSTLPAGVADGLAEPCSGVPLLLDVVYAPWPTELARASRGTVVPGSVMLLHQAARQVELMTGSAAPLGPMAEALEAALGRRGAQGRGAT